MTISIISCGEIKKQGNKTTEVLKIQSDTPDWLLGSWERVGEKEGNQTYEYWNQNNKGEFIGMGCTLNGGDTIWREDVLLSEGENGWTFEVVGLGDSEATVFKVTHMAKDKFVCKNDQNEFPKKIEYAFDGNNINAVISGGGPTIPFNFVRMKQ